MTDALDTPTRLRMWMAREDVSCKEMAARIGCSLQTVARLRRGERAPTLRIAQAVSAITGGEIREDMWPTLGSERTKKSDDWGGY